MSARAAPRWRRDGTAGRSWRRPSGRRGCGPPPSGPACRTTESTPLGPGTRPPASTATCCPVREDSQPPSSCALGFAGSPSMSPPVTCTGSPRRPETASRVEASDRPPGRAPRPRQIGVAGSEVLGAGAQRGQRVLGDGAVGDPPVGEDGERVGGQPVRGSGVPPRDDRRVGGQQRQDDGLGVQAEPPVHPHDDGLARAEPPADEHLGVQAGRGRVELPAHHDQEAAGVRLGGLGRGLLGLADAALVGDDDEGERHPGEHRAAGAALAASSFTTAEPVVSHRRASSGVPAARESHGRSGWSRSPPPAALGGQHLVGGAWAPLAGPVGCGRRARPELLERVDHAPRRPRPRRCGGTAWRRRAGRRAAAARRPRGWTR